VANTCVPRSATESVYPEMAKDVSEAKGLPGAQGLGRSDAVV
jgi:hypothetical protein